MARQGKQRKATHLDADSAASVSADPTPPRLRSEVAALQQLSLGGLRTKWREVFGAAAPPHLPKYLLFRILAYRIQAAAFGDLDPETLHYLNEVAQQSEQPRPQRETNGRSRSDGAPPAVHVGRSLKAGSILVREHAGVLHRVVVLENGFSWEGKSFRSLSETAMAISGTNWSGPRFFGLGSKSLKASRSSRLPQEENRA